MTKTMLSAISAVVLGLVGVTLRCNSVLSTNPLSPEPCTNNCGVCTTYCNSIMQACSAQVEYLTTDVCIASCNVNSDYWLMNELPNDMTTFACRQAWANDAGAGISCANAGPLGGSGCVSSATIDRCTTFCQLEVQICANYVQYDAGVPGCMSYCEEQGEAWYVLPDSGSDLATHENGDDTLNCRFYHLENAMKPGEGFGPATHCPHTGRSGGGVCFNHQQDAAAAPSGDASAEAAAATATEDASDAAAADE